jgi:hypothetical protein
MTEIKIENIILLYFLVHLVKFPEVMGISYSPSIVAGRIPLPVVQV